MKASQVQTRAKARMAVWFAYQKKQITQEDAIQKLVDLGLSRQVAAGYLGLTLKDL